MEAKVIKLPAREATKHLTMTVKVRLTGAWRIKAGLFLIALGTSIMGINLKVEHE